MKLDDYINKVIEGVNIKRTNSFSIKINTDLDEDGDVRNSHAEVSIIINTNPNA